MSRSRTLVFLLAGSAMVGLGGPVLGQTLWSQPARASGPAYYADRGGYDNSNDADLVAPRPRQRLAYGAQRRAPKVARDLDDINSDDRYADLYNSGPTDPRGYSRGYGSPLDLAPEPRSSGRRTQRGVRVASLPADADPAYSTPLDYDSEVDMSQTTRQVVADPTGQPAGTITVNTGERQLYLSLGGGRAMAYGVGVGREGFLWKGAAQIGRKAFWPGWTPPEDMRLRRPDLPKHMEGGIDNPLGARALYLFKGAKDTMFRIHGTNEPNTIGHAVSSGCIRMMDADVIDLYQRVQKGAKVVVL